MTFKIPSNLSFLLLLLTFFNPMLDFWSWFLLDNIKTAFLHRHAELLGLFYEAAKPGSLLKVK